MRGKAMTVYVWGARLEKCETEGTVCAVPVSSANQHFQKTFWISLKNIQTESNKIETLYCGMSFVLYFMAALTIDIKQAI